MKPLAANGARKHFQSVSVYGNTRPSSARAIFCTWTPTKAMVSVSVCVCCVKSKSKCNSKGSGTLCRWHSNRIRHAVHRECCNTQANARQNTLKIWKQMHFYEPTSTYCEIDAQQVLTGCDWLRLMLTALCEFGAKLKNAIKYVTPNWISSSAFDLTKCQPFAGEQNAKKEIPFWRWSALENCKEKSDHGATGQSEREKNDQRKKNEFRIFLRWLRFQIPFVISIEAT